MFLVGLFFVRLSGGMFLVLGVLKAVKYVRGLLNISIAAMTFIT